ncbi:GSCOCG00013320001-RA-CDS [Cotesia congregata]|nr:GSCOCG00013320001-RA-CDS [Cotesia congregata]
MFRGNDERDVRWACGGTLSHTHLAFLEDTCLLLVLLSLTRKSI